MNPNSQEEAIQSILRADPRYPREAYEFVCEALDVARKNCRKSGERKGHHVTGQELPHGMRLHALEEFGPLALTVLQEWNVRRCEDVGEIVFNLVSRQLLGTSDGDSREDFRGGFEFEEAFRRPFEPSGRGRRIPRRARARTPRAHKPA